MSARRIFAQPARYAAIAPYLWMVLFFLVPFGLVLKISLSQTAIAQPPYVPLFDLTEGWGAIKAALAQMSLDNFKLLVSDNLYVSSYLRSLVVGVTSTLILLLIGYPIAYGMARLPQRWQPIAMMLVIVPFWTSFLIRIYAWINILQHDGLLNKTLLALHLVSTPVVWLSTDSAMYIGIVYSYLPFMILPLYATLSRMDAALLEAASDLGASPPQAFWLVTVPLSLPGVGAGALLCFIPIVGEFVIPDLLAGSGSMMIGQTLWLEFFTNKDWPVAAAPPAPGAGRVEAPRGRLNPQRTRGRRGRVAGAAGAAVAAVRPAATPHAGGEVMARKVDGMSPFNVTSLALGLAFLYLPIVILVIYSFNASRLVTVWGGWSLRWYYEFFNDRAMLDAAWMSLRVAAVSASIATLLGTLAAVGLVRGERFRGRTLFSGMLYAPLVMPEVISGLSLLLLFVALNAERGFWTVTIAHTTLTMCFVTVVVQSRLAALDRSLEEAAMDLGCDPVQAFLRVTLPLIIPAIAAGWMLAFTLSLDDVVIASFTTGPGSATLPIRIYSEVRLGVKPEINAICTMVIAFIAVVIVLASLATKLSSAKAESGAPL